MNEELEEIKLLTDEQKDKIETTINTRVKKLSEEVKDIKKNTKNFMVNNSPHGIASISIYFFMSAQSYYALSDYRNASLFFAAGLFMYIVQQALFVLKIKINDGDISKFLDKNKFFDAIGEATGFYRAK